MRKKNSRIRTKNDDNDTSIISFSRGGNGRVLKPIVIILYGLNHPKVTYIVIQNSLLSKIISNL